MGKSQKGKQKQAKHPVTVEEVSEEEEEDGGLMGMGDLLSDDGEWTPKDDQDMKTSSTRQQWGAAGQDRGRSGRPAAVAAAAMAGHPGAKNSTSKGGGGGGKPASTGAWTTWGRTSGHGWRQSDTGGWGQEADSGGWGQGGNDSGGWGNGGNDNGWGQGNESQWGQGGGDSGWGANTGADWGNRASSVAESTDGGNSDNGAWGHQAGSAWGSQPSGWENWAQERAPKVTFADAEPVGTRNILSPQQRSQILNSLLNQPIQNHRAQGAAHGQKHHDKKSKSQDVDKGKQKQQPLQRQGRVQHRRHQSQNYEGWGTNAGSWGDGWGDIPEEDEDDDSEDDRRVRFSPKSASDSVWGTSRVGSAYTMPSRTLTHAFNGTATSPNFGPPRGEMYDFQNFSFTDSRGEALEPVQNALFGKARLAKDRIHWMFPSGKDERVTAVLGWIDQMSYNLGAYGLHKFLQSRERGALITNAAYRPPKHPNEPAFDWLTFDDLQRSRDQTLQTSAAFYDPAVQVIVFILLPSETGNSVAMWRRKLKVPNNVRLSLQPEINLALAGLRKEKDYVVHVDELPNKEPPPAPTPPPKKKKVRWWNIFEW